MNSIIIFVSIKEFGISYSLIKKYQLAKKTQNYKIIKLFIYK